MTDPYENPSGIRFVAIDADGTETDIAESVAALYDLVLGSMDWGSGFLSAEEAVPVLEIGKLAGYEDWRRADDYVNEQRFNPEQERFLEERGTTKWKCRVGYEAHTHVWASTGKCMWPGCGDYRDA